ncbi:MAG: hypothetical protein H6717_35900 [Polyangiaceae bacterium]|nr:hypothetical protein [Polyangiaceae bacterium]
MNMSRITPLPLDEHPRLELDADFVHVHVVPVEAGQQPFVEVLGEMCSSVDVSGGGGTTRVRLAHPGQNGTKEQSIFRPWWDGRFWDASFWEQRWKEDRHGKLRLHVPRDGQLRILSNAGRVHVEHLWGCDLSVEAHAGRVTLDDVTGRLRLETQAGRIDGTGIGGTVDVSTSAGAVRLDIAFLAAGRHTIRTSMGAIRVALARGMPVHIDAKTSLGSARVDFPSLADADASLFLEADLGAIRVSPSNETFRGVVEPVPVAREQAPAPAVDPYRSAGAPTDAELQKILARVADGSLSPQAARELLRAMGIS